MRKTRVLKFMLHSLNDNWDWKLMDKLLCQTQIISNDTRFKTITEQTACLLKFTKWKLITTNAQWQKITVVKAALEKLHLREKYNHGLSTIIQINLGTKRINIILRESHFKQWHRRKIAKLLHTTLSKSKSEYNRLCVNAKQTRNEKPI